MLRRPRSSVEFLVYMLRFLLGSGAKGYEPRGHGRSMSSLILELGADVARKVCSPGS